MKKSTIITAVAIIFAIAFSFQSFAADQGHSMGTHESHSDNSSDSGHMGVKIHESTVEGHNLTYSLIDMREKMKDMKNMPADMKITHHLMVHIKDSNGHNIEKAKVGYLVEGPGDSKQKLMCMGMEGGFGSDVDFSEKGKYTVKTKVAAGDKMFTDQFEYEVK